MSRDRSRLARLIGASPGKLHRWRWLVKAETCIRRRNVHLGRVDHIRSAHHWWRVLERSGRVVELGRWSCVKARVHVLRHYRHSRLLIAGCHHSLLRWHAVHHSSASLRRRLLLSHNGWDDRGRRSGRPAWRRSGQVKNWRWLNARSIKIAARKEIA